MNSKTKNRKLTGVLLVILTLFLALGAFIMSPMKASAATNRAGAYMISGTYDIGDGSTSGYLDKFKIQISTKYFTDDSSASVYYNNKVYNWTYFNFYIYTDDIKEHTSFKLTRNGSTYVSKSLSGTDSMYLYQGTLPDGDYVLTYVGTYKPNWFVTNTYTFTYKFEVDTSAPTYTLKAGGYSISSGSYTNKAIAYAISDANPNKIYYRSPSSSTYTYTTSTSKSVSATSANNGWWYFYSVDDYNNSNSVVSLYLDTVAPVGKVTNSNGTTISNGGYTNKPVKYTATDTGGVSYYQVKTPGASSWASYTSGTALSSATGWYTFRAVDKAGNTSTEYKVYYDATVPTGTLYGGTSVKSSGAYTNATYIKYVASDSHSGINYCYVKKPGASAYTSYTSNTQLITEGTYYFYCVDKSGNQSSVVSITLDKTVPTGTLYGGTSSKTSGSYTNASYIKYTATDSLSGVNACYVKMPGSSYYTAYASGTQLATEGTYYFYCVDKAGNQSSVVSITLDKTKPTGTLYGGTSSISSGSSTNADYIKFVPYDAIGLNTTYVKKPGATSYVAYTSGTQFTAEGVYSFYSVDKANNTSATYTVTLDRQIPAAQLYVDGNAISNNSYTNGAYISFECGEDCYVKVPGSDSFVAYLSGAEYYKEGKYVFYGLSDAGNSTGYYTIIIDRTIKSLEVNNVTEAKTNGDVTLSWTDGDAELFAPIKTVTVNGKTYTKGDVIHTIDTGVYKVKAVDMAGNVWETEFTSTKQNVLTKTLQKEYYEIYDVNGDYYSFATYESAFNFAVARENSYVRKGTWNNESWDTGIAMDSKDAANAVNGEYFIYKKSGSPNEEVAYFTLERLNEVIAEYAEVGIESYYYWEKEPATIADGENLFTYSDTKTILADKIEIGENIGILLDGEEFVGTVIEAEGKHTIIVSDDFGNTCEYSLIIIRKAPSVYYAIGEGEANLVTFDRTYYLKNEITVSISDGFDEFAMFSVYDDDGNLLGNFSLGETFKLSESGTYTVEAVNHFGNSETFKVVISLNAPTVSATENEETKKLEIVITPSVDKESHIQTLEIYKSTDNGETWELVEKDDYGVVVAIGTNAYSFRTSGKYKVVVTDEFLTGIDAVTTVVDYVQKNPVGELKGVENGGYTNGNVSFEWTDEAIVIVEKDGEVIPYVSGQSLTENGAYTVTFENHDNFKTTMTFIIDKDSPVVTIEGATERSTVNGDVKVNFTEESLSAELFKDGVSVGAYVSGTAVTESGDYKVVVTDLANNTTEVTFGIDKVVDYEININDKGLANSVTVKANEDVTLILTKGEEVVEYKLGDAVTNPGTYTATLTDKLGNSSTVQFTIVEPLVKSFEHNFDNTPGFEKVMMNGEEKRLNYGTLELFTDGVHEVSVIANGKTYTFTVTVDSTAPAITITGAENGGTTKDTVILSDLTEDAEMRVYLNDQEIEYKLGDELTELGKYRVVLTDECGNSSEYTFEILYSMNGGAIALIVIGILAVIGVIVAIIVGKKATYKTNKKNGNNRYYN